MNIHVYIYMLQHRQLGKSEWLSMSANGATSANTLPHIINFRVLCGAHLVT